MLDAVRFSKNLLLEAKLPRTVCHIPALARFTGIQGLGVRSWRRQGTKSECLGLEVLGRLWRQLGLAVFSVSGEMANGLLPCLEEAHVEPGAQGQLGEGRAAGARQEGSWLRH